MPDFQRTRTRRSFYYQHHHRRTGAFGDNDAAGRDGSDVGVAVVAVVAAASISSAVMFVSLSPQPRAN